MTGACSAACGLPCRAGIHRAGPYNSGAKVSWHMQARAGSCLKSSPRRLQQQESADVRQAASLLRQRRWRCLQQGLGSRRS